MEKSDRNIMRVCRRIITAALAISVFCLGNAAQAFAEKTPTDDEYSIAAYLPSNVGFSDFVDEQVELMTARENSKPVITAYDRNGIKQWEYWPVNDVNETPYAGVAYLGRWKDRCFLFEYGYLTALDTKTGKVIWREDLAQDLAAARVDAENGRIYICLADSDFVTFDSNGILLCRLDALYSKAGGELSEYNNLTAEIEMVGPETIMLHMHNLFERLHVAYRINTTDFSCSYAGISNMFRTRMPEYACQDGMLDPKLSVPYETVVIDPKNDAVKDINVDGWISHSTGVGESLICKFREPVNINSLVLEMRINDPASFEYQMYNRPRIVEFEFSNGVRIEKSFSDSVESHTVRFSGFSGRDMTDYVRITFKDYYPGKVFSNMLVSMIRVYKY